MKAHDSAYRKNFSLIIVFLILISVTFIIALFIAYSLLTIMLKMSLSKTFYGTIKPSTVQ